MITATSGLTATTGNVAITAGALTLGGTTRISNAGVGTLITGTVIGSDTFTTNNITDSGALTVQTTGANLILQPSGTGTTGNVQIGAANGGGGSTTPDLLVLDQDTTTLPAGTNGAILLDSTGKFNIYEGGAWKVLCNQTDAACGAGSGSALSAITAATGGHTINSGNNDQVWNWSQTSNSTSAFTIGENTAGTATSSFLLNVQTLNTSTVNPLVVTAQGTANGVKVDTTGLLQAIGTGGIKATDLVCAGCVDTTDILDGTIAGGDLAANITISTTANISTTSSGTITSAGLLTASGGLTIAANQNLTMTSGTGQFSQTYTGTTTDASTITANSLTS